VRGIGSVLVVDGRVLLELSGVVPAFGIDLGLGLFLDGGGLGIPSLCMVVVLLGATGMLVVGGRLLVVGWLLLVVGWVTGLLVATVAERVVLGRDVVLVAGLVGSLVAWVSLVALLLLVTACKELSLVEGGSGADKKCGCEVEHC